MRAMMYWSTVSALSDWLARDGLERTFEINQRRLVDTGGAPIVLATAEDWMGYLLAECVTMLDGGDLRLVIRTSKELLSCAVFGDKTIEVRRMETELQGGHATQVEFAAVSSEDEFEARHQWTSSWSTKTVGVDACRYAPGLYWWTYFSTRFSSRHQLDLECVSENCVREVSLAEGRAFQMYPTASGWNENREAIEAIIGPQRGFFDIRDIPELPEGTLKEMLDFSHNELIKWP